MKNIARLSLVLNVVFLIMTTNESNASVRSQQDNQSISFNDVLPNNTVNAMDSEQPVLLAKRWGHYKRKHVCFDRINKRHPRKRFKYKSRWCRNKRAQKARRARKHYRSMVVKYHKRKAQLRRTPICKVGKSLLSPRGLSQRKSRCYNPPPWPTAAQRAAKAKKARLAAAAAASAEKARLAAAAPVKAKKDYCLQKGWGNKTVNVCADARKYYKERGWSWIPADVPEKCYRAGFRPIVNGVFASKPNRFECFPTVAECIQALRASGQGNAHPGSTQSVGNLRRGAKTHTAYYLNKLKRRNMCQPYPK